HRADAIGLSALLVTTSKQMPLCIQALDRRGVHVPVLIGGAAINRAFGRRAGVLPDGRVYAPAVFYCKDVFEGAATLDALQDPQPREAVIAAARAEIAAERGLPGAQAPRLESSRRSTIEPVAPPTAPYWGARRVEASLRDV